jgi:2-acylglycerol O-acyltransferase 2
VYTFGESLSVGPDWVPFFELRRRLSYWADAPIRYLSLCQRWLLPFPNGRLVTVVGAPIAVGEKTEKPSRGQVRELHARYCAALLELIESTKEEAGYGAQVTELV